MTTSRICELFRFAWPRRWKHGSASVTSGWKVACALFALCVASTIAAPAQIFENQAYFNGANGSNPHGSLVQGLDGSFYGTTYNGGANNNCSGGDGCGTVFKFIAGALTTLHSFNGTDGAWPAAGLVQGTDGNFYGTTGIGGDLTCNAPDGCGTVFKITPSGTLTTLHIFNGTDGASPSAGLIQGTDGDFYGTTWGGALATNCANVHGCGTVFRITPAGTLTTLHTFNGTDGAEPGTALIQGTDGNFYGTTADGGSSNCTNGLGCGTIFKMTSGGTVTTLHIFNGTDGVYPSGALVQGTDGNLYGTIVGSLCCGMVFKITPSGTLTALHSFTGPDGSVSPFGLVQATDGNFYAAGVVESATAVFKITFGGALTTYTFDKPGAANAPLIQATNGTFYGISPHAIFSIGFGLGWFNEELPNYGKVADSINILGTNLTGASGVTFNGTAASFTIVSPTLIQATVPPGAGTGYVRVVLPGGRIPSNKKFRVTPQITSFTPTDGPPGTLVTITGVSLAQIWAVTIRGVHANFTVVDNGTVTATVPTGATTGTIRIAGPGGAATSTTNFTVD